MISLRPRGQHGSLRQAASKCGAGLIALSPWALQDSSDPQAPAQLRRALRASRVVFTSPAAVRAANRLQPLAPEWRPPAVWLAVGGATAAALRRAGITAAIAPTRMDSEGLLALPELQGPLQDTEVGLVTAPGGRGMLAPALRARGALVVRADVYRRTPIPLSPRAIAALQALDRPAVVVLSSGEALERVIDGLPAALIGRLQALPVVASSGRLAAFAGELGFGRVRVAVGPRPRDLVDAACPGR